MLSPGLVPERRSGALHTVLPAAPGSCLFLPQPQGPPVSLLTQTGGGEARQWRKDVRVERGVVWVQGRCRELQEGGLEEAGLSPGRLLSPGLANESDSLGGECLRGAGLRGPGSYQERSQEEDPG